MNTSYFMILQFIIQTSFSLLVTRWQQKAIFHIDLPQQTRNLIHVSFFYITNDRNWIEYNMHVFFKHLFFIMKFITFIQKGFFSQVNVYIHNLCSFINLNSFRFCASYPLPYVSNVYCVIKVSKIWYILFFFSLIQASVPPFHLVFPSS